MSKKILVKMPEGHLEIHNEQGALYCPFQNKIPIQQNNGSMVLIPIPCTSGCPHFEIDKSNRYQKDDVDGFCVGLSCGGIKKIIFIDEEKEQKLHTTPFAKA